ncbi:MAG TPA: DNA-processing protein DprA [Anaerolineaceae bacterium]
MAGIVVISPEDENYPKDRLAAWFPALPALHTLGNLDLLRLPLTALFCSRKCPGDAILKAYDLARELREKEIPVIGGFHTPVEKDMLEILLKGKGPIVICPARGLEGMRMPKVWREGVDQERIIFLSIAPPQEKRITLGLAHQRNLLVAGLARERVFVHAEPGGETEKVSELFSM